MSLDSRDVIRSGPLCSACPTRGAAVECADCRLRAGAHLRDLPGPETALLPAEPRTWFVGLLSIALITGIVMPMALIAIDELFFTPERAVSAFFGALEDRDAAAAFARLDVEDGDPSIVTTPAMLAHAGYTPPSGVDVRGADVERGADNGSVEVAYTLGATPVVRTLRVVRDGTRFGLFSRWVIDVGGGGDVAAQELGAMQVVVPVEVPVTIAGTEFTAGRPVYGLAALPGIYAVSVDDNPLYDFSTSDYVSAGETQPVAPVVKDDAAAAVQKAVRDTMTTCARSTAVQPPNCPFRFPYAEQCPDTRTVRYTVLQAPTVTLTQGDVQESGVVSVGAQTEAGQLQFSGNCGGSSFRTSEYVRVDVAVAITDGKLDVIVTEPAG